MTIEEAIRVLDPETGFKEVSKYPTCDDSINACIEAGWLAADALRKRQWISVKDRLPEKGERVLITNGGFVCESFLATNGEWQRGEVDLFFMKPTHWQPLPEPPKEG